MKLKTATLIAIISCCIWIASDVITSVMFVSADYFDMDKFGARYIIEVGFEIIMKMGFLVFFTVLYKNQK